MLMAFMDVIDVEVERWKQQAADDQVGDALKADMLRKL
jgi:hypothetical protein